MQGSGEVGWLEGEKGEMMGKTVRLGVVWA